MLVYRLNIYRNVSSNLIKYYNFDVKNKTCCIINFFSKTLQELLIVLFYFVVYYYCKKIKESRLDSLLLKEGDQIYHNYIREHEGLNGRSNSS